MKKQGIVGSGGTLSGFATSGAASAGATAVGAMAVGAMAAGAVAIGALAIRRLAVKRGKIGHLKIEELEVGRLRVGELVVERDLRRNVRVANIIPGRYTAKMEEPFVVFIIGMRINNLFAVKKWLPTVRAMQPMLRELYRHPEKGFLGGEFFLYWRGPAIVQYWRSFEDLERFARNPDDPHMPAWQRFNRSVGSDGSVGIFHETYIVERANYEAIYSNMPEFGLAKATEHVRAVGGRETARRRLMRGENEPAVPSPE